MEFCKQNSETSISETSISETSISETSISGTSISGTSISGTIDSDIRFEVDVSIEIPKNSHIKYEYDIESKTMKCDRILHTPFNYFFNYSFKSLIKRRKTINICL